MQSTFVLRDYLDVIVHYYAKRAVGTSTKKALAELYWVIREFEINDMREFSAALRKETHFVEHNTYFAAKKAKQVPPKELVLFLKKAKAKGNRVYLFNDCKVFYDLEDAGHKKKEAFTLRVNRKLFGVPVDTKTYFSLINIIYASLKKSSEFGVFWKEYKRLLKKLMKTNPHLRSICAKITTRILRIENRALVKKELCFVDTGFNGTFPLLCCALVEESLNTPASFYLFSTWPWLTHVFKGSYYSKEFKKIRLLEGEKDE